MTRRDMRRDLKTFDCVGPAVMMNTWPPEATPGAAARNHMRERIERFSDETPINMPAAMLRMLLL